MTEINKFTIVGKGSEQPIQTAIQAFLLSEGWEIHPTSPREIDLLATRAGITLAVEVKGNTGSDAGTDVDTLYGQILRSADSPSTQLALGYPVAIRPKIDRVPTWMQKHLQLLFFEVDETGKVTQRSPEL